MNALRRHRRVQAFEVALQDCLGRMGAPTAFAVFMSVWSFVASAVLRRRSGERIEGIDPGPLKVGDVSGYDRQPVLKTCGGDEPV